MSWDYNPRKAHVSTLNPTMNHIIRFQERGALLREIATATGMPIHEIHREIISWLRLRKGRAA